MSIQALIDGTVAHLKSKLQLSDAECDEQPWGQPPPSCGQRYIAVHQSGWSNQSDMALDEKIGLAITITMRSSLVPVDRQAKKVLKQLRELARSIMLKVHMDYELLIAANALIPDDESGFCEPLQFRTGADPEPKGPDWFWAEGDARPATGVAVTLQFADARRVQKIEDMG